MHKRYLVYSSVGDLRRVDFWNNTARNYDVFIANYGEKDFEDACRVEFVIHNHDFKIPNFLKGMESFEALRDYDYYFFIDDDLLIEHSVIEEVFRLAAVYDLDLCQPAFQKGSFTQWPQLVQKDDVFMEYVNFCEVNCFCISRRLLRRALPFFYFIKSGFGLDLTFTELLRGQKEKIAVFHRLSYFHPHREKEETVRGKIKDFHEDAQRRTDLVKYCLGIERFKTLDDHRIQIYKTIYAR